jgi:quercetin dioxygenase-like cupin family protein
MTDDTIAVPGCRRTLVTKLYEERGKQILKVDVEPGGEIPLHAHECAATMIILEGTARALGKGDRIVQKGDMVVKAPQEPHGFTDVTERFSFISISDKAGIMREDAWDMVYL